MMIPARRSDAIAIQAPRYFTGKPCRNGHTAERLAANGHCVACAKTSKDIWTAAHKRPQRPRAAAKIAGQARYFTGRPCPRGHIAERQTSTGQCVACRSGWTAAHRSSLGDDEFLRRRRARPNAGVLEAQRRWRADNPDKVKAYRRAKIDQNREYQRQWRGENPEADRRRRAGYRASHRDLYNASAQRRRAAITGSEVHFTAEDLATIRLAQDGKCKACDADLTETGEHIDHELPLSRGGSNGPGNIQLLCPSCNLSKNDRTMEEWLQSDQTAAGRLRHL